jgi:hypothetical protein
MVVVRRSTRTVHLLTAAGNRISRAVINERLQCPIHRGERGGVITE